MLKGRGVKKDNAPIEKLLYRYGYPVHRLDDTKRLPCACLFLHAMQPLIQSN